MAARAVRPERPAAGFRPGPTGVSLVGGLGIASGRKVYPSILRVDKSIFLRLLWTSVAPRSQAEGDIWRHLAFSLLFVSDAHRVET
jgi:hypothetical protein